MIRYDIDLTTMKTFEYSQNPLKTFYILFFLLTTLLIRIPYWAFKALLPSWRQRPSWTYIRDFMTSITKEIVMFVFQVGPNVLNILEGDPKPVRSIKNRAQLTKLGLVWVEGVPKEMIVGEVAEMANTNRVYPATVPGYWYGARSEDGTYGQSATVNEKVLFHLHGGGYIMGTGSPKGFNSPVPISLLKSCNTTFNRAFSLSYRLSSSFPFEPTNPFPAALLDALAGYRYLTQTIGFSPDNIVLSGDSAGGHLALSLVTYLAETSDQPPSLQVPGALILLSPFADMGGSHNVASESRPVPSMLRNANTDFSLPFYKSGYSSRSVLGVLPPSLLQTNRYFSPASLTANGSTGQFAGFPPTFIVAGGAEVLLDSIRTLRDRMKADIGEGGKNGIVYAEYEHANHDFLTVEWHEPERSDVLRALARWLESLGSVQEIE